MFYVYIKFRPCGTPCYVGKGRGNRAFHDGRGNPHLQNIARKAGGKLPTVIVCRDLDEATAFEYERAWIAAIGRGKNGPLVNLTAGGEGASDPCEESRANMSKARVGKPLSPETCKRMSRAKIGKVFSKEHRAKIGEATRVRMASQEARAKIGDATRSRMSDLANRLKMSETHKGRVFTETHRSRISASLKLACSSSEIRTKMSVSAKARLSSPEARAKLSEAASRAWARKREEKFSGLHETRLEGH